MPQNVQCNVTFSQKPQSRWTSLLFKLWVSYLLKKIGWFLMITFFCLARGCFCHFFPLYESVVFPLFDSKICCCTSPLAHSCWIIKIFYTNLLSLLVGTGSAIWRPAGRSVSIMYQTVCQVYPEMKLYCNWASSCWTNVISVHRP